jgi:hypothetical protein
MLVRLTNLVARSSIDQRPQVAHPSTVALGNERFPPGVTFAAAMRE